MGGGKTHNMISLGLLAKHPEIRSQILGKEFKEEGLGVVEVIAISGRESNSPHGIRGDIAKQLGKAIEFKGLWENGLRAL